MTIEVLDPTYEEDGEGFRPAPRLDTLDGAVVGVISNGKHGTTPFFDALERELVETHRVAEVVRVTKPNYSAPAGADLIDRARAWRAVITGIGD